MSKSPQSIPRGSSGGPRGCSVLIFERVRPSVKLPGRGPLPYSPDLRPHPFREGKGFPAWGSGKEGQRWRPIPGLHPIIRSHNMENYQGIPPPQITRRLGMYPSGTFSVQMLKTRLSPPSRPEIVPDAVSHLDSFSLVFYLPGISACQRVSLESPASAQLGSILSGVLGSAGPPVSSTFPLAQQH